MSRENMSADQEYQYPQDEYVVDAGETILENDDSEETVSAPKLDSPLKQFLLKNKRKVAAGGVAVLVLIIFQVMTHNKERKILKPASQPSHTSVKKATMPATVTAPKTDTRLVESLQSIQNSGVSNTQEIRRLKDELQGLQNQLDQANRTNQQLKQAMLLLLQQVKQVNEQLKKNANPAPQKATLKEIPKVSYFVRAMINGRAWLLNSEGQSHSVTVGDVLPGFGTVNQIDSNRGVVVTSTGKIISYGSNDS